MYHDVDAWRRYMSDAGFVELSHYYRPSGLPRERRPAGERLAAVDLNFAASHPSRRDRMPAHHVAHPTLFFSQDPIPPCGVP